MAETFNPIISHLYCGQGGASTEVTKYDNATISEINVVDNGVTTKYDFGGKYVEKMYSGDRVWNQYANCPNPRQTSTAGNTTSDKLFAFNTNHKYCYIFDYEIETDKTGIVFIAGIWNNDQNAYKRKTQIIPSALKGRYAFVTNGTSEFDNGSLSDFSSVKVIVQAIGDTITSSNKVTVANVQLIDLTDTYGAGNEPSTYAEFYHDYKDDYYPYNAGTVFSTATKLFSTIKQPLDSIKFYGNTMRWCQLVQNGNFADTNNWSASSGSLSVSGNVGTFTATSANGGITQDVAIKASHKYLITAQIKLTTATTSVYLDLRHGGGLSNVATQSTTDWQTVSGIISASDSNYAGYIRVRDGRASDWDAIQIKNTMLFDLTYIFGVGNEPTTASDFTRRLKKLYYPYTPGEIISIEQATAYLYGLNLWDEEWEVGSINLTTGANAENGNCIRSKNYIIVRPDETYYCVNGSSASASNTICICYDGNKNIITGVNGANNYLNIGNTTFTVPINCCFIRFFTVLTTYNNDICISLSNASTNGTYEASKDEQKMQLDSFNVWDEEWEVGRLKSSNGEPESGTNQIRSKNFICVLPNTDYYFLTPFANGVAVFFYDANKNFISLWGGAINETLTTPSNCVYIKFYTYGNYGTTYNHDICINLSDPSRNGIYVPYRGYVELNGINDAVDTVTVEKNIPEQIAIVDLGSLVWYRDTAQAYPFFYTSYLSGTIKTTSTKQPILTGAYTRQPMDYSVSDSDFSNLPDKTIGYHWNGSPSGTRYIYIKDLYYTDPSTFINSLKGKYMYFQLEDVEYSTDNPILAGSYVRKISPVDLGTLDWYPYGTTGHIFRASLSGHITENAITMTCAKYECLMPTGNPNTGLNIDKSICALYGSGTNIYIRDDDYDNTVEGAGDIFKAAMDGITLYYELATPVETTLTAQQCAEILNGAFTKSKYSTILIDNDNGQIDQTVDVGMWEQR